MQDSLAMLEDLVENWGMKKLTPWQIAAAEAIGVLGGPVKAAVTLGVPGARYQTVQSWLRNRVPAEYCPRVERETARLAAEDPSVKVYRCEQLRPDVEWDVLRRDTSFHSEKFGAMPLFDRRRSDRANPIDSKEI